MALSKCKQNLVDEMKNRGFSNEELDWHLRKSTIAQMQIAIDNDEAHIIIARLALEAGKHRTN